jgi:3-oxoacyl-[acyl-carrier protein] reductase
MCSHAVCAGLGNIVTMTRAACPGATAQRYVAFARQRLGPLSGLSPRICHAGADDLGGAAARNLGEALRRPRAFHSLGRTTAVSTLKGKVAIVSGAGRGIGRAVALKLGAEGARVVVNDMDAEPAQETVAALNESGAEAVACPGSVTEPGFAERFVATAVESFGGLDIVVNNAGYTWDSVVQKMSDEQWDAMLDVHLTAPFRILRAVQPVFAAAAKAEKATERPARRKVINVSSVAGLGGNAGQINYSAAKAGIVGLTKTLAKEWGRYGVTVNAVAFGLIETRLTAATADGDAHIDVAGQAIKVGVNPQLFEVMGQMIPLGRAGTPEEAAGSVYLFCIPESDYVSGQVLICGGGLTI